MNIIVISNAFPRQFNLNMGSYVYDQIEELKKLDNEITLVSPSMYIPQIFKCILQKLKIHCFENYIELGETFEIGNIRVICPKVLQYGRLLRKWPNFEYKFYKLLLFNKIKKIVEESRIELIYAIGTLIEGHLAYDINKKLGVPYVVTEHSNNTIMNSAIKRTTNRIYAKIASNSKCIFFVSSKSKELFLKNYGNIANAQVLINGFRAEEFRKSAILSDLDHKLRIVSVGFLEERKGWNFLLECVNKLSNVHPGRIDWTIIGDGPLRELMEERIIKKGLSEVCTLTGIISHKDVLNIMANCDVFCLVSTNEPLGIVYLEAMSTGTPIIGTKGEGISDIIINKENGYLVEYGNETELIDLLSTFINNREDLARVGLKGRETAIQYSWSGNVQRWMQIVRESNR